MAGLSELKFKERTPRDLERKNEDKYYTPVIIKRNDDTFKHLDDILKLAIDEGCESVRRDTKHLLLSSMAGGISLGFSALAISILLAQLPAATPPLLEHFLVALLYPLGFIICVMTRCQLFTEQTALGVYPFLDRRCTLRDLLRMWTLVLVGNLIGVLIISFLIYQTGTVTGIGDAPYYFAKKVISFGSSQILVSSMIAGWLMSVGGWLVLSSTSSLAQVFYIFLVTFLIGFSHFHHSIVGSSEVLLGYFVNSDLSIIKSLRFILIAIVGNLIGGSLFVAFLNYGRVKDIWAKKIPKKFSKSN